MQNKNKLYGAILGDLCGQPFEFASYTGYNKPITIHNPDSNITDDSLMTLATAYAILNNVAYESAYKYLGNKYTNSNIGYGGNFAEWLRSPFGTKLNSWGNGCLMRCSPVFYAFNSNKVMRHANIAASCLNSHDSFESVEACLNLDKLYFEFDKYDKPLVDKPIKFENFEVKSTPTFEFVEKVFAHTTSTNDAILKAVECGGDTDTNASIVGELSTFHYNDLTEEDIKYVESKLDPFLMNILYSFNERFSD